MTLSLDDSGWGAGTRMTIAPHPGVNYFILKGPLQYLASKTKSSDREPSVTNHFLCSLIFAGVFQKIGLHRHEQIIELLLSSVTFHCLLLPDASISILSSLKAPSSSQFSAFSLPHGSLCPQLISPALFLGFFVIYTFIAMHFLGIACSDQLVYLLI